MSSPEPIVVLEEVRAATRGKAATAAGYSLELWPGEMVVIAGASGSEKSELLQIAAALRRPRQGKSILLGVDAEKLRYHDDPMLRRKTAFVFQDAVFIQSLTTTENIQLPLRYDGELDDQAIDRRTGEVLEAAGLKPPVEDVFDDLPPLQGKKAALARAWAREPLVVFYDEPGRGLDPVSQRRIFELIEQYHARRNAAGRPCAALLACNDPRPAIPFADRLFIMADGTLTLSGDKNNIRSRHQAIEKEFFDSIRAL